VPGSGGVRRLRDVNPQTLRAAPARSLTALTSLLLTVGLLAGCGAAGDAPADASSPSVAEGTETEADADATFSYEGVAGKTALELLLAADPTAVLSGEGENAFVTGIEGREAQESAKEFWALYVNGEAAQVGAGSLVTETGDEITWKLETF